MQSDTARYLIVGNSTAAVGAIEGLRRIDRRTPIVLVAREPYHVYSRPLISYLLAGAIDEERMWYRPKDFYRAHDVDARLGVEVTSIDVARRAAVLAGGGAIPFDRLLIASGGRPFVPPMPGAGARGVFTFTTLDDAKALARHLEAGARRAVVIGGGLIGIKAAEALHARGVAVTIVELADRVLPLALDEHASEMAGDAVRGAGVDLVCGTTVVEILPADGSVAGVRLKDGRTIECDTVVVAIGVVPDLTMVEGTPIAAGRGIVVDERCRTSVDGIYAAGDVTQAVDCLSGQSRPIPIFPNAYRQGCVAGTNMAGGGASVEGMFPMNSVDVFGLATISVGLATASGPDLEVLVLRDDERGAYKRIVLRAGRVVGALLAGAVERAGILTGLIRHGVDVSEIKQLLLTDQFGVLSLPARYRTHVVAGEGIMV